MQAMETLVAVAEEGSLSAGARRLGVSKALVSRVLGQVEARLGQRLFNRTTRALSPTEAGARYLAHARAILEADAAFEAELTLEGAPRGHLRLAAPLTFGTLHVAPAMVGFMAAHPGVTVGLELSDAAVDLVESGVDLALRIGLAPPDSAVGVKLGETRHVTVAAPGLIAARGAPGAVEDLRDWPALDYAGRARAYRWRGAARAPAVWTSNNGEAVAAAAEAGLGVAVLPEFIVAGALADGRLVTLFPEALTEPTPIWALYPHRALMPRKTRAALDWLKAALRGVCG